MESKRNPMYGNCLMLAPDGTTLTMHSRKRANWYISKDLAEIVSDDIDGFVFKLKFNPKIKRIDDLFYVTKKDNVCVVCCSCEDLTAHHIVPRCYRRYFPKNIKSYSNHDILPLCVNCHLGYEKESEKYKNVLFEKFNVTMNLEDKYFVLNQIRAGKYASSLLSNKNVPETRKQEMLDYIKSIYDVDHIDLKTIQNQSWDVKYSSLFKEVVDKIINMDEFIIGWRKHFVDTLQPQFLPDHWDVNRTIEQEIARHS